MARPSLADFKPKPRNDAYTAMLSVSLIMMISACTLLYFNLKQYPSLVPPASFSAPPLPKLATGGGTGGNPSDETVRGPNTPNLAGPNQ